MKTKTIIPASLQTMASHQILASVGLKQIRQADAHQAS